MNLSKRVALEEIVEDWQHMTEWEKDFFVLQVFIVFDKRARWLLYSLTFAVLLFLTLAIIVNVPAPVFISIGFAAGILSIIFVVLAILTIIKRR